MVILTSTSSHKPSWQLQISAYPKTQSPVKKTIYPIERGLWFLIVKSYLLKDWVMKLKLWIGRTRKKHMRTKDDTSSTSFTMPRVTRLGKRHGRLFINLDLISNHLMWPCVIPTVDGSHYQNEQKPLRSICFQSIGQMRPEMAHYHSRTTSETISIVIRLLSPPTNLIWCWTILKAINNPGLTVCQWNCLNGLIVVIVHLC